MFIDSTLLEIKAGFQASLFELDVFLYCATKVAFLEYDVILQYIFMHPSEYRGLVLRSTGITPTIWN